MSNTFATKIFSKNRKQKYPRNKFFSYSNANNDNKNFNYKDFRHSTSYNSSFRKCSFFGVKFQKSKFKFCSFVNSNFIGISFINCNFKGSNFSNSYFENCLFLNCSFIKCKFRRTRFLNTFVSSSCFKNASNLNLDLKKFDITNLNIIDESKLTLLKSKFTGTNVENLINKNDINRLLCNFNISRLEFLLDILKNKERIDTVTVSHVLKENLTVSKIDVNCQFNCNKSSLTIDN